MASFQTKGNTGKFFHVWKLFCSCGHCSCLSLNVFGCKTAFLRWGNKNHGLYWRCGRGIGRLYNHIIRFSVLFICSWWYVFYFLLFYFCYFSSCWVDVLMELALGYAKMLFLDDNCQVWVHYFPCEVKIVSLLRAVLPKLSFFLILSYHQILHGPLAVLPRLPSFLLSWIIFLSAENFLTFYHLFMSELNLSTVPWGNQLVISLHCECLPFVFCLLTSYFSLKGLFSYSITTQHLHSYD